MFIFDEFTCGNHTIQTVFPEREHAPALFNIIQRNQTEFAKWLPWVNQTTSVNDELAYIDDARLKNAKYEALTLVILCDDCPIGTIDLHNLDSDFHTGEIGYWLDAKNQGQGIMSTTVQRLADIAFIELNIHKLSIHADVNNHKSIAVGQHAGFKSEAILKDQIINQHAYSDLVILSKIADN